MKKKRIIIGAIVVVLIIGGLAWIAQQFELGKEEKKTGPVPQVEVAKLERKTITEKVIVYGSVVAQPGKTHSVSIALETRVRHILVAPGQFVKENDPLIEIELSPGAASQECSGSCAQGAETDAGAFQFEAGHKSRLERCRKDCARRGGATHRSSTRRRWRR